MGAHSYDTGADNMQAPIHQNELTIYLMKLRVRVLDLRLPRTTHL